MKTALITGSNRGIGFEAVRQFAKNEFYPILTARSQTDLETATKKLEEEDIEFSSYHLDVQKQQSVDQLVEDIEEEFSKLDVLVNNAAIMNRKSVNKVPIDEVEDLMDTNLLGPWRMIQGFEELLRKSEDPRIINVSSGSGQIDSIQSYSSSYKISKLALNGLTLAFDDEFGDEIAINSMNPGWVKTDMGGSSAPRSVEEGVDTIIWLATVDPSPSGKFFKDREEISW